MRKQTYSCTQAPTARQRIEEAQNFASCRRLFETSRRRVWRARELWIGGRDVGAGAFVNAANSWAVWIPAVALKKGAKVS